MAKDKKEEAPSVKTKTFKLRKPFNGKAIGDSVELGPRGEQFYKSNNTI